MSTFPPSSRLGKYTLSPPHRKPAYRHLRVYANVKFEVDDLEKDWTWPVDHFDFIHARSIEDGIKDHERFVKQMFTHLKPGGYAEISEVEHGMKPPELSGVQGNS